VSGANRHRQRLFLQAAVQPGATLLRSGGWIVVEYGDYTRGPAIRGADFGALIAAGLVLPLPTLELTPRGEQVGARLDRLLRAYDLVGEAYGVVIREADALAAVSGAWEGLWLLIEAALPEGAA
jgi:hypothetical protein